MPRPPKEKHRAWADLVRTAAALCAAAGTVFLVGTKVGWW